MKARILGKRILTALLAASLVVTGTAVPKEEVKAGVISIAAGGNWKGIAVDLMERTVLFSITKAGNAADEEAVAEAFTWTKRILAGNSSNIAAQTLQIVKEIAAELDALYSFTMKSNNAMLDKLNTLIQKDSKNAFNAKLRVITNFNATYEQTLENWRELFHAMSVYGDPENQTAANKEALASAYQRVYDNCYKNVDVNADFLNPLYGATGIDGFLPTISPYKPTQELGEEPWVLSDWVQAGTEDTYLDAYYTYLTDVTNLENNVYDGMRSASQVAANAAYQYQQAYRYYAEFASIMISGDASLTEEQKDARVRTIWNDFNTASGRLQRGLNQMASLYDGTVDSDYDKNHDNVFAGYMRSYDLSRSVKISGYQSKQSLYDAFNDYEEAYGYHDIQWDPEYYNMDKKTNMSTHAVKESQRIYQFRLTSEKDNTAYAVRQSDSDQKFLMQNTWSRERGQDYTTVSLDLLNLLKDTENGYHPATSISEFSKIADMGGTAYVQSDNLPTNLKRELSLTLGDSLAFPNIPFAAADSDGDKMRSGPGFLILRTQLSWDEDVRAMGLGQDTDMHMTWANVSMPYDAGRNVEVDMEDDIHDHSDEDGDDNNLRDQDVLVMYKGTPSSTITPSVSGSGTTTITSGNHTLYSNGAGSSAAVTGGDPLTILAKPGSGQTLDYIRLTAADGTVLEEILGDEVLDEAAGVVLKTQELLEYLEQEEDGSYSFRIPTPMQDAKIEVAYKALDPSLIPYTVTLEDAVGTEDGKQVKYAVAQFGGNDYLAEKSFTTGSTVTVSLTGYHNHVPTGIVLKDAGGNELKDIPIEDVTESSVRTTPTERIYSFTMPSMDVSVDPLIGEARSVTVSDTPHITHNFDGIASASMPGDSEESSWGKAATVSFVPGTEVSVSFLVESGYMLSRVDVYDPATRRPIPVTVRDGGISFVMPDTEVSVQLQEEVNQIRAGLAALDVMLDDVALSFVDHYGWPMNVRTRQILPGNTVIVQADVTDGSDRAINPVILTQDGDLLDFEELKGEVDQENRSFSFRMPSGNILISTELLDEAPVEIRTPELKILEDPTKVYDGEPVQTPEVSCESSGALSYAWYLREGDELTKLPSPPTEAGDYRLVVTAAPAEPYGEASAYLDFRIITATVFLDLSAVQEDEVSTIRGVVFGISKPEGTVTFVISRPDSEEKTAITKKVTARGDYFAAVLSETDVPSGVYTIHGVYHSASGNYEDAEAEKTFTEGKRRSILVEEERTASYGDGSFSLDAEASETNGSDQWSYEIVQDDFTAVPLGTASALAEKSLVVSSRGMVSVKHAGKSVIRITLSDASDAAPVDRYYDATVYVTVEVKKAPLTVTSFSLPDTIPEGELSDVTYGLRFSGLRNGDTRKTFTHGYGTLSPVPVAENAKASETPYEIGITREGVPVKLGNQVLSNYFISRDYEIRYVNGTLLVTEEGEGKKPIPVTEVSFDEEKLLLAPGESTPLQLSIAPSNYTNTGILWESTNEGVAEVSEDGIVTANAPGEAIVRAVLHSRTGKLNGVTRTAFCRVSVARRKVSQVMLSDSELTLQPDDTWRISAQVAPANAEDAGLTWESSKASVAEVKDGVVTAKAPGDAVITAMAGSRTATCRVHVISELAVEDANVQPSGKEGLWIGSLGEYTYQGSALTPHPNVYYGSVRLTEGRDYRLSWKNNVNAGTGSVTISPRGSYGFAKVTAAFLIKPLSLSDPSVVICPAMGEVKEKKGSYLVQKLVPTLTFAGKALKEGRDFTVTYGAVTEPGTYQKAGTYPVTLTGQGNFTGDAPSTETLFEKGSRISLSKVKIRPKSGAGTVFIYDPGKPDTAFCPEYELYCSEKKEGVTTETVLKEGTDYFCTYENNKAPGKAAALFTAAPESAYYGSASASFLIKAGKKDLSLSSDIAVTFPAGTTVSYEKAGARVPVQVTDQGRVLTEGVDYTLTYRNEKSVSDGKKPQVLIKGKGDYTGTKALDYTVVPSDLSSLYVMADDFIYSDKPNAYQKTKITLLDRNGDALSPKDFKAVSWEAVSSRPKPGEWVTVTLEAKSKEEKGSGLYTGSIRASFRILNKEGSIASAKITAAPQTYEGKPVQLTEEAFTAKLKQGKKERVLLPGQDFEILSYQNNDRVGTAAVTIRGIGDFGGLRTVRFRISKAD